MYNEEKEVVTASLFMAIIGVGYLFPFSALTQPVDFWHHVFPDFNIEFPLTTLYMWVNLLALAAVVFWGGKTNYEHRIVAGLVGQALVLVLVPSLYFFSLAPPAYYMAVMTCTALAAIATALVDSVAIGFAAHYPVRIQEGLQIGIGLSTLLGSIYRIITKLAFPPSEILFSSITYFYVGAATICMCVWVFYALLRMRVSQVYFHAKEASVFVGHDEEEVDEEGVNRSVSSSVYGTITSMDTIPLTPSPSSTPTPSNHNNPHTPLTTTITTNTTSYQNSHTSHSPSSSTPILAEIWANEACVCVLFASTLLCWPALVSEIPPHVSLPEYFTQGQWYPLLLLLLFAVLDCLGRYCTRYRSISVCFPCCCCVWLSSDTSPTTPSSSDCGEDTSSMCFYTYTYTFSPDNIHVPTLLRLLLLPPLVGLAKVDAWAQTPLLGYFCPSSSPALLDALAVTLVGLLGFTNGYIGSLCVLMCQEKVVVDENTVIASNNHSDVADSVHAYNARRKGEAGAYTGFFLNLGLVLGATGGMLLKSYMDTWL